MQDIELLKMLGVLFASKLKNPDEKTIKVWVEILKEYNDDDLKKAIKKLIYTKEDFISIGMIHELINPPKNIDAEAIELWTEFITKKNYPKQCFEIMRKMRLDTRWGDLNCDDNYSKTQLKNEFLMLYKQENKTKEIEVKQKAIS